MENSRGRLRLSRTARTRRPAPPTPPPDHWERGTAIAGILSVLLVGVGLILTNDFNRDQLALQQQTAREQQDLALKGQRADRFVRAVDQLGQESKDKLGVRLGGIYALEALMKEFPADENVVIEVLCAFIRSHAPYERGKPIPDATPDVRAAMTVLGRRPDPDAHIALDFTNTKLGLEDFDLPGATFPGADLSIANFERSKLMRANLRQADLEDSYFDESDLTGATMEGGRLMGTDFSESKLVGANLRGATFSSESNLIDTDLTGADLTGATGLTTALLACAKVDAGTRLPAGVVAPAADAWRQKQCAVLPD